MIRNLLCVTLLTISIISCGSDSVNSPGGPDKLVIQKPTSPPLAVKSYIWVQKDNIASSSIQKTEKANLNNHVTIAVDIPGIIKNIAVDSKQDYVYWIEGTSIMRAPLDGTNINGEEYLANLSNPREVSIGMDSNYLYWNETVNNARLILFGENYDRKVIDKKT